MFYNITCLIDRPTFVTNKVKQTKTENENFSKSFQTIDCWTTVRILFKTEQSFIIYIIILYMVISKSFIVNRLPVGNGNCFSFRDKSCVMEFDDNPLMSQFLCLGLGLENRYCGRAVSSQTLWCLFLFARRITLSMNSIYLRQP